MLPSLTISSPTFLAFFIFKFIYFTRPKGPNFGANVAAGPGSPPKTLILTNFCQIIIIFTIFDFCRIDLWWHLDKVIYKLI